MGREPAGFERSRARGGLDCPAGIADHVGAEIESEYEAARGVVFNNASKIQIGFCAGGALRREESIAGFSDPEWITAKMKEARSSLEEDTCLFPTFSRLHPK